MAILEWNYAQPNYLEITHQINVAEEKEKLEVITERLKNALEEHKELPYVTANQVGYNYQVYALRMPNGYEVYANPLMAKDGEIGWSREVEFGLENNYYIPRWSKINVVAFSVDKSLVCQREYTGEAAGILQHVMNNLNGISIEGFGLEILPEFDAAPVEEQEEVLRAYLSELNTLFEKLDEEVRNDSEVGQQYEAVKFTKAVAANEIKVEYEKPNRKTRRFFQKMMNRFLKKGHKK